MCYKATNYDNFFGYSGCKEIRESYKDRENDEHFFVVKSFVLGFNF